MASTDSKTLLVKLRVPSARLAELQKRNTFPFLDLPGELRNRIYRHAYVKPEPLLIPSACRHYGCEHGTSPAIAQVNRQIRKEFQDIFYTENTFEYHIHRCDFTYLFEWLSTIESHNRKRICNIRLVLRDRWTCGGGLLDLVRWCAKEKGIEHIVWTVDGALAWSYEHATYAAYPDQFAVDSDRLPQYMKETEEALKKAIELARHLAKGPRCSELSIRRAFACWIKEIHFEHDIGSYRPSCEVKPLKRGTWSGESLGGFCSWEDRLAGHTHLAVAYATAVCHVDDDDLNCVLFN